MEINKRLMGIRPDEMIELTRQTRQILLRSYLRRGIAPPTWIVKPSKPRRRTGGAQERFSALTVCLDVAP